jgi:hypothetical protein
MFDSMKAAILSIAYGHAIQDCHYLGIAARKMNCSLWEISSNCCSLPVIECANSHIISLDMNYAGCSGNISTSLANLTQLRSL